MGTPILKSTMLAGAVAIACTLGLTTAASAVTIFSDSFENPVNAQDWQVYQSFDNWNSTAGTGIEVQTSGTVVNAYDGNQYVELDSDPDRGGIPGATNSSMTRTLLSLSAGSYELEWHYLPRTGTANDNIISVFLDSTAVAIGGNMLGQENGTRPPINTWETIVYSFVVGTAGDYNLTFAAGGLSNEYGGFIDSVTLSAVPVPLSIVLLGSGLAFLGAAGRRRKS